MKKSLKLAAALTAAALIGGAAFAQVTSMTYTVTQKIFTTPVDNYGNARNWSTVSFDKAFVAADASVQQLGVGGAGRVGGLYLAGWYTGNVLWRSNTSSTATANETGSYNVLLGIGADSALPIGIKLGFKHSGTNVHEIGDPDFTPSLSVGLRMANLGPLSLFRVELGAEAPLYDTLGGGSSDASVTPNLLLQAGVGAHNFQLQYKPTFYVGLPSSVTTSSHFINFEYLTSKNFENGLTAGMLTGANFTITPTTANNPSLTNTVINFAPYLAGAFKWSMTEKLSLNLGAKVTGTLSSDETKATGADSHSWSWTPTAEFGSGFTLNMTDNAWLDTAVLVKNTSDATATSNLGITGWDSFVTGLKIQAAIRF